MQQTVGSKERYITYKSNDISNGKMHVWEGFSNLFCKIEGKPQNSV